MDKLKKDGILSPKFENEFNSLKKQTDQKIT